MGSRYWPLPFIYGLIYAAYSISNAIHAAAKAGSVEVPLFFSGWVVPVIVFVVWSLVETWAMFMETQEH